MTVTSHFLLIIVTPFVQFASGACSQLQKDLYKFPFVNFRGRNFALKRLISVHREDQQLYLCWRNSMTLWYFRLKRNSGNSLSVFGKINTLSIRNSPLKGFLVIIIIAIGVKVHLQGDAKPCIDAHQHDSVFDSPVPREFA